ncbi:pyridoxal phosphate-dependent aminotransferase [Deinococcus aquiradiocola]|uniref:Histidinol-phosphate aminotransferase n=1 Tax=Deinococcus aquiradiocola TaxID=393059 RepID=A0A917P741_9DEIO|nr:histidinol-phosphate transaminase [Deinococcus aquiradiocola]GGJ64960.1 histidinol-phosphate aminotransferase [Deinococcus aquiradiocola]
MPEALQPLLAGVPHGGPGRGPFTGTDFSVNTNPFGPNPELLRAVRDADHAHYPDPSYAALRARLAAWHGLTAAGVVPSVGASELLHRVARAYLRPGDRVLSVLSPFGEFGRAAALCAAHVTVTDAAQEVGTGQAAGAVTPGTRLVYLGHPHNPTGRALPPGEVAALQAACRRADALLIVDAAYAPFVDLPLPAPDDHTLLLHSPGKAHGLVGARPAYAVAGTGVAAALQNLAPAWALPAGTAALLQALPDAQAHLHATLPRVAALARVLARDLARLGEVEHHGTPYMTLRVPDAAGVTAALLDRGLKVRDCTSYGAPHHVRVSARGADENAALVSALAVVLAGATSGQP